MILLAPRTIPDPVTVVSILARRPELRDAMPLAAVLDHALRGTA